MKQKSIVNYLRHLVAMLIMLTMAQSCKTTKQAIIQKEIQPVTSVVTYETKIRPIMLEKCTPCHFPEKGIKKMLDTYEKAKANGDEMLYRVQLAPSERGFMPYKSKKPALTNTEIAMFKGWIEQGMPK